jgi:hypothetical protein
VLVRLSGLKRVLVNTNNHREINTRDMRFYPVVRPSNTCLLPRCGILIDEGCTQPLSSDPMINLNTTAFFLIVFFPFARNLHKLEPLALTKLITKNARVRLGRATHTRLKYAAQPRTQVTTSARNTTHGVHNSNGAQITITKNRMREVGVLES